MSSPGIRCGHREKVDRSAKVRGGSDWLGAVWILSVRRCSPESRVRQHHCLTLAGGLWTPLGLRIQLSVRLTPFSLNLNFFNLSIQVSLVGFPWFAGGQRFVLLSFDVSLKWQHEPLIVPPGARSCTGAAWTSSQLVIHFLPQTLRCHLYIVEGKQFRSMYIFFQWVRCM